MLHLRILLWVSLACLLMPCSALAVHAPQATPAPLSFHLSFPRPTITRSSTAVQVEMSGGGMLSIPGEPLLPLYRSTVTIPFGTPVTDIRVDQSPAFIIQLPGPIACSPAPVGCGLADDDSQGNTSGELFPARQVTYQTGSGLDANGSHVTFLTLSVVPGQYDPVGQALSWSCNWSITLTLGETPASFFPSGWKYQLVIITPDEFVNALKPLQVHKDSLGVSTAIKTLSDIYQSFDGQDQAEQIKFFIKTAVETWGVRYVLLVGGLNSQVYAQPRDSQSIGAKDWWLPVRYSNLCDNGSEYDPGFISDLYYADLYNGEGEFCSWDSNGDGIFGEWSNPNEFGAVPLGGTDTVDFYPDVYLGRLPCRNVLECRSMVTKIIAYESTPLDASWFSKAVVAAGDPYYDVGTNVFEGEAIGNEILSLLDGFQLVRLFASFGHEYALSTPLTMNIKRELRSGCGFLVLDGHGASDWWNTCWPGHCNSTITFGGLSVSDLRSVHNWKKLPVCIIGGCHCCLFNVTFLRSLADWRNRRLTWSGGHPVGQCLGEALVTKRDGGAISVIGSTGIGYEASGENGDLDGDGHNLPDCCEALGGYLEILWFQAYANGTRALGQAWGEALNQYLDHYPGMENRDDAKTLEQWIVFGDPSLRVGGY
jgi:hypothetical protein